MSTVGAPDELPPAPAPAATTPVTFPPPLPAALTLNTTINGPDPGAAVQSPSIPTSSGLEGQAAQIPEVESEGSASDHDESDSEGDDGPRSSRWYPIEEDTSRAEGDELTYIEESGTEHSALDEEYWERKTFFDIKDPDVTAIDQGKIDFVVEKWNGTRDDPRTELVVRSEKVQIGGLDWQIKVYPRGNDSEYVSVFLECPSVRSPEWIAEEDFEEPPFPFLEGVQPIKKRRSVAAQIGVVMYNPAEPRVHEHHTEAHQFHQESSDYGWRYFTRYPRYELHMRQHLQRQSILKDDKIAFRAYIRVVNDPTGCLWDVHEPEPDDVASMTGLRPFAKSYQYMAGAIPLLHFRPFRDFIKSLALADNENIDKNDAIIRSWLQTLLIKLYTRKRSTTWDRENGDPAVGDVMEMLWRIRFQLSLEFAEEAVVPAQFKELVGMFHAEHGSACGSERLNTKTHNSVQAAVDHHAASIDCPQLLTLELQRHEHDKTTRKWKRLTNKVEVSDYLTVSGVQYTLFAFITHSGHLQSHKYNWFVRPRGPGKLWQAYHEKRVTTMTETMARKKHSGIGQDGSNRTSEDGYDSPLSGASQPAGEVTCAVMYVRDDVADYTFNFPAVESWQLTKQYPQEFQKALDEPPQTAVHETFAEKEGFRIQNQFAFPEGEQEARLDRMAAFIAKQAELDTPEPSPGREGEDVIMKDADATSDLGPLNETHQGTRDWLGREYYEGHWNEEEQYHGGGHLIKLNGDEYLGEFEEGAFSGWGKMIYSLTGDVYEGDWQNGVPHGKGKLIEHSTGNVYEGSWTEGKKTGEFVLRGTVTEDERAMCTICYSEEINTAFYTCGHVIACYKCANREEICPICRRPIVARLQLYGVRMQID